MAQEKEKLKDTISRMQKVIEAAKKTRRPK